MLSILRIGHRPQRDKRVTTHVGLVARAFGADQLVIAGSDDEVKKSIDGVSKRFGGSFKVIYTENWRRFVKDWKGRGIVVHLTMYGEELETAVKLLPKEKDMLVIVGAQKVPREAYELADFNISVGNQPHSEVAALAIFIDRYFEGAWQNKDFKGRLKILPTKKGKRVEELQ